MSKQSVQARPATRRPVPVHRRRPAPDDHLCACGELRDGCVRTAVRSVWADSVGRSDPAVTPRTAAILAAVAASAGRSTAGTAGGLLPAPVAVAS